MKEICNRCGVEKSIEEFSKNKSYKSGYSKRCKKCSSELTSEWKKNNKEKVINWSNENKDKKHQHNKNRDNKKYYSENKEKIKEYRKKYKDINPEKIKEWYFNSKEQRNFRRNYRRNNDFLYKISYNIRNLVSKSFKRNGYSKNSKTKDILGCSYEELKIYLESKFESWMNWNNYGKYNRELNYGWDIDHIIPISSALTEVDILKLNHYTNLQPLCSKVNRDIKKDKK